MKPRNLFMTICIVCAVCVVGCENVSVQDSHYAINALTELIGEWQWIETKTNNPDYTENAGNTNKEETLCIYSDKQWSLLHHDTLVGQGTIVELFLQTDTIHIDGTTYPCMKLYDALRGQYIQRYYTITFQSDNNITTMCTYLHPYLGGESRKIWKKVNR